MKTSTMFIVGAVVAVGVGAVLMRQSPTTTGVTNQPADPPSRFGSIFGDAVGIISGVKNVLGAIRGPKDEPSTTPPKEPAGSSWPPVARGAAALDEYRAGAINGTSYADALGLDRAAGRAPQPGSTYTQRENRLIGLYS